MIEKFLESYVSAFLSHSPASIAKYYEFPAIFYTESGEVVSFTEEQFLSNTSELLRKYKSIGVSSIDSELLGVSSASNSLELISVLWHFKAENGAIIYSANTKYLVKKSGCDYKIVSVIIVNEYTRFSKVLQEKI